MLSPFPPALHIFTFAQALSRGGVERSMLRLVRGWAHAGHRVTLVIADAAGVAAEGLPDSVAVMALNSPYFTALRAVPELVRQAQPDLIFCPGNHYSSIAAWARLQLGDACPPIVAKISNRLDRVDQHFPLAQAYRGWLRLHPGFIDHLVAMSAAMRDETIAMTGMPADRVSVIANPPAVRARTANGATAAPSYRYLLGLGRLTPQKRWDRLIGAMPAVAERDANLLILGEGATRPALEQQVDRLRLRPRVRLPGYDPDPHPALAGAAALVLTSDFEGVPGVVQEALAIGTPVVATDSSVAIREMIPSDAHGSIVPRDDPHALVAALDHWLAPGRPRPDPLPERGADSVERYLDLFDRLVFARRRF